MDEESYNMAWPFGFGGGDGVFFILRRKTSRYFVTAIREPPAAIRLFIRGPMSEKEARRLLARNVSHRGCTINFYEDVGIPASVQKVARTAALRNCPNLRSPKHRASNQRGRGLRRSGPMRRRRERPEPARETKPCTAPEQRRRPRFWWERLRE